MGAAVISATDLFRQRDFDPSRRVPDKLATYVGLFASIVDLNGWLEKRRAQSPLPTSAAGLYHNSRR
jgi:hypothetical protein